MTLKALLKVIPEPEKWHFVLVAYGHLVKGLDDKSADDLRDYRTLPVVKILPGAVFLDMGAKLERAPE